MSSNFLTLIQKCFECDGRLFLKGSVSLKIKLDLYGSINGRRGKCFLSCYFIAFRIFNGLARRFVDQLAAHSVFFANYEVLVHHFVDNRDVAASVCRVRAGRLVRSLSLRKTRRCRSIRNIKGITRSACALNINKLSAACCL